MSSFPEIRGLEAPALVHMHTGSIGVLVAEPDTASRNLICSLVECDPEMTAECIDGSRLISSIQENDPDLVILDANTPAIRQGGGWAITKTFKVPHWESAHFGVGAQFFNIFNHPHFDQPDADLASSTFGQIINPVASPTSIFGSFLGADASPRLIQLHGTFTF